MATTPDRLTKAASDARSVDAADPHIANPPGKRCNEENEASALGRLHFDATHGSVAPDAGAPESVFLAETPLDTSPATLGVTVTWPLVSVSKVGGRRAPACDAPQAVHDLVPQQKTPSSLFRSESQSPLFGADFASSDLAPLMMMVFQRSSQLYPCASIAALLNTTAPEGLDRARARGRQASALTARLRAATAAALVRQAALRRTIITRAAEGLDRTRARGRQASALTARLRAATAAALVRQAALRRTIITRAAEGLDRARARRRQAARFCRPAGRAAFAAMSSGLRLRVSRTGVRRVSWAAAALCLASVLYVAWAATSPTNSAAASRVAAADAVELRPAAVTPPVTRHGAPIQETETRQFAGRKAAFSRPPARPTTNARIGANSSSVKPAALPRGYVGSLVVTSEPDGAEVSVDGVPRGHTPVTIRALNAGSRVIRVAMPGHQLWSWSVSVVAGKETPVTVKLLPTAPSQLPPVGRSAGFVWP